MRPAEVLRKALVTVLIVFAVFSCLLHVDAARKRKDKEDIPTPPPAPQTVVNIVAPPVVERKSEYKQEVVTVTAEASFKCIDGFQQTGANECMRQVLKSAKIGCRDGFELQKEVCLNKRTFDPDYVCDSGFVVMGNTCYKRVSQGKELQCPDGYIISGTKCQKNVVTNALNTCPQGYKIVGSVCSQPAKSSAQPSCPDGYIVQGEDCVNTEATNGVQECDKDYQLFNGRCSRTTIVKPVYVCTEGATLSGNQCYSIQSFPATAKCPEGMSVSGGECRSEDVRNAAIACPENYNLVSSAAECVRDTSAGTLKAPAVMTCPSGYMQIDGGKCRMLRIQAVRLECPPDSSLNQGHCLSRISVQAKLSCPMGMSLDVEHNSCQAIDTKDAHLVCPEGMSPDGSGMCRHTKVLPVKYVCPPNFELDKTGQCIGDSTTPPTPKCPGDYVIDKDGKCTGSITTSPISVCPRDFTDQGDGSCAKEDHANPIPVCPDGAVLKFDSVCEVVSEEKAGYICPSGFTFTKSRCQKNEYSTPSPVCPDGFDFDGNVGKCTKVEIRQKLANVQQQVPTQIGVMVPPAMPAMGPPGSNTPAPRMVYYPQYLVQDPNAVQQGQGVAYNPNAAAQPAYPQYPPQYVQPSGVTPGQYTGATPVYGARQYIPYGAYPTMQIGPGYRRNRRLSDLFGPRDDSRREASEGDERIVHTEVTSDGDAVEV